MASWQIYRISNIQSKPYQQWRRKARRIVAKHQYHQKQAAKIIEIKQRSM